VIATAWHWPPSELDRMPVTDLLDWAERAAQVLGEKGGERREK
jgi:hypothetical protein